MKNGVQFWVSQTNKKIKYLNQVLKKNTGQTSSSYSPRVKSPIEI